MKKILIPIVAVLVIVGFLFQQGYGEESETLDNHSIDNALQRTNAGSISLDRTVYPVPWEDRPPLKQFRVGIAAKNIVCEDGFQLIKSVRNMPACVSPQTKQVLIQRGWSEYSNQSQQVEVTLKDGTKSFVSYDISNGIVKNILPSIADFSLIVEIEGYGDGMLDITIPRGLVDARLGKGESAQDDFFFVLVNGHEVDYTENTSNKTSRSLSIPFSKDANIIEIIGTFPASSSCC